MIDLAQIIEKIEARAKELGMSITEISVKATGAKDTIRNWKRTLETDQSSGEVKGSATITKLNQVESAIGIELARNSGDAHPAKTDAEIVRVVKQIDGVGDYEANLIVSFIRGPMTMASAESKRSDGRDRHTEANRPRVSAPSE